jgi:hypothetical protein
MACSRVSFALIYIQYVYVECVYVISGMVYRDRSRSAFLDTKSLINLWRQQFIWISVIARPTRRLWRVVTAPRFTKITNLVPRSPVSVTKSSLLWEPYESDVPALCEECRILNAKLCGTFCSHWLVTWLTHNYVPQLLTNVLPFHISVGFWRSRITLRSFAGCTLPKARLWNVNDLHHSIKGSCTAAHLDPTGQVSITSVIFLQILGA